MRITDTMDFAALSTKADPGHSGIILLTTGEDSLLARLSLINSAKHSLDLQYYAINNDITGNMLFDAIVHAADRGVKIRLLIDDISIGVVKKELSALDCIGNIDVRIFNPINKNNQSLPARVYAFFARMRKATRRMHNKALIADRKACITGGRNLGDEYFDAHKDMTFKDLDVLSLGPVAESVHESFDLFWNHRASYPIARLYKFQPSDRYVRKIRRKLEKKRLRRSRRDQDHKRYATTFEEFAAAHPPIWSLCEFLSDDPEKIYGQDAANVHRPMEKIANMVENAGKEFLIVSPYFVPSERGCQWLDNIVQKGISVSAVTNSLASTDVVAVHTGYKKYRRCLLEAGVQLFELKTIDGRRTKQRVLGRTAPSYASLHAKVYIIDGEIGVIGSLNFDPRSVRLNTESALIIHDKSVAQELIKLFNLITAPETSHRLRYEGRLVWESRKDGKTQIVYHEPEASIWRRIQDMIFSLLPVEDQL